MVKMVNFVLCAFYHNFITFKILFIFKGEEREKERKRNMDMRNIYPILLVLVPTRDQTCNPGMCPNWESNRRPFTLQDNDQPTEPQWSGQQQFEKIYNLSPIDVSHIDVSLPLFLSSLPP